VLASGAQINGEWEIDGAYFLMRLGPSLRGKVTNRIGYAVSGGLAAAYVGSTFNVRESFTPSATSSLIQIEEDTTTDTLVFGFYALANAEYWLTETTGLYGGASYESLSDYDQSVGGRTAKVDVGQGVAIRGGVVLRF
jgi:hypothetical protein